LLATDLARQFGTTTGERLRHLLGAQRRVIVDLAARDLHNDTLAHAQHLPPVAEGAE